MPGPPLGVSGLRGPNALYSSASEHELSQVRNGVNSRVWSKALIVVLSGVFLFGPNMSGTARARRAPSAGKRLRRIPARARE